MKLAALVVVAFLFAVTGDARAGGGVDWSEYLDDGSKVPVSKTPQIAVADGEDDEAAAAPAKEKATKRTAKTAKAKKGKKTSKAKAAKAKTRAKAKKRRR